MVRRQPWASSFWVFYFSCAPRGFCWTTAWVTLLPWVLPTTKNTTSTTTRNQQQHNTPRTTRNNTLIHNDTNKHDKHDKTAPTPRTTKQHSNAQTRHKQARHKHTNTTKQRPHHTAPHNATHPQLVILLVLLTSSFSSRSPASCGASSLSNSPRNATQTPHHSTHNTPLPIFC